MDRYRAVMKTQRINSHSFECKVEALDDAKVNTINLFFNINSNLEFNSFCFKCFKDERHIVDYFIHACVRGLDGKKWIANFQCMPTFLMIKKKQDS